MRLELSNINKIKHASVEFGGLTLIAGINDTGKSTIGKTLFCAIKAISGSEGDLFEYKTRVIREKIENTYKYFSPLSSPYFNLREEFRPPIFMEEIKPYIENAETRNRLGNFHEFILHKIHFIKHEDTIPEDIKNNILEYLDNISNIILQSKYLDALINNAFQRAIDSEFMGAICTEGTDSSTVSLFDKASRCSFSLKDSKVISVNRNDNFYIPLDDATFLETPLYLQLNDLLSRSRSLFDIVNGRSENRFAPVVPYHIKDLMNKLELSKYPVSSSSPKEWGIESIISGRFEYNEHLKDFCFSTTKNGVSTNLQTMNVASGIKTFGIIQLLLDANELNPGKMLIIDEPENHLHPKWQIDCAHLIVNLVKEGIPVMVSSHSPYFIQGIRFFAEKEEINDLVKYYLAENEPDTDLSILEDVTDNLNKIFIKLSEPLNNIMNIKQ